MSAGTGDASCNSGSSRGSCSPDAAALRAAPETPTTPTTPLHETPNAVTVARRSDGQALPRADRSFPAFTAEAADLVTAHSPRAASPPRPPPQPLRGPKPSVLGKASLCCCGVCVLPPGAAGTLPAMSLAIAAPVAAFLTSVEAPGNWWSLLITTVLFVGMWIMLLFATTCDPGILLPADPDPERKSETLIINGTAVECKVCYTCHIVRPPRSGHCHFCDNCVEEFDHHCGVLGSCVAKRTFRFFAGFMWFGTLLSAWVFVRSVIVLASWNLSELQDTSWGRWRVAAGVICCIYTAAAFCCLATQGSLYCELACKNSTQREFLRAERRDLHTGAITPSLYDEGPMRNFCSRMFGPLGRSRLERHIV